MRRTVSDSVLPKGMSQLTDISSFGLRFLQCDPVDSLVSTDTEADVFRQLAFDLVSWQMQGQGTPLSVLAGPGPDGAIDFSGLDTANTLVLGECKVRQNYAAAKKAIPYLEANLLEMLSLSDTVTQAPCYLGFRPWRDPSLSTYIYCLSCSFESNTQKESFHHLLLKMFGKLAKDTGRTYLSEINVTLYDWNDLKRLLETNAALSQKWLATAPVASVIGKKKPPANGTLGYYDYLDRHDLPYISRDEYRQTHPEAQHLITESHILSQLLSADKNFGCLIYGERGIGKTRLMRQLGENAKSLGWMVFGIAFEFKKMKRLIHRATPGSKYLLLMDNLDPENLLEDAIFPLLLPMVQEGLIKMIITCRRPPFTLTPSPATVDFWTIDLGLSSSRVEQDFRAYVSRQILAIEPTMLQERNEFYSARPAFAVFLHYIQTQLKKKYPAIQFTEAIDFNDWLASRLPLSFPGQSWLSLQQEQKEVFYLFALLPTSPAVTQRLYQSLEPMITHLKNDGWLDEAIKFTTQGKISLFPRLRVIFEVIADEMLKCRLDYCQASLHQEILDIFSFAIAYNSFEPCFHAFERIADRCGFKRTNSIFYPILTQLIGKYPNKLGDCNAFILTPLLSEEEIVCLMADNPFFFADFTNSPEFPFKLSTLINFFVKKQKKGEGISDLMEKLRQILQHWFPIHLDFMENRRVCLRLISTCLLLFEKSVFLWAGAPTLTQLVKESLRKYGAEKDSVFLIATWLETGGETKVIRPFMESWLNRFPTIIETNFVITAWLEAMGEKERVRNALKMWLSNFSNVVESNFLIRKWLDIGGSLDIVRNAVHVWLKTFPQIMETHIVISSWLKAHGEKEVVQDALLVWLDKYGSTTEFGYVWNAWLESGGEPSLFNPYIAPWLRHHAALMEDTSFILKGWLNHKGEADVVADFVLFWLDQHCHCYEATYVIEAWLNNTNDLTTIQQQTFKWLSIFKDHKDADFVIKRLCRSQDIPDDTMMDIIFWCRKYADYNEVLFKLDNLIRNHIFNPLIADTWLLDILSYWITQDSLTHSDIGNIECIMFNLTRNNNFASSDDCTQVFIQWFLSPHSFRQEYLSTKFNFLQLPRYFYRYHFLITQEKISAQHHEASIRKFLKWVASWSPQTKNKIQIPVQGLEALIQNQETNN